MKINQVEIKRFFKRAMSAKENGESLSKIFDDFARQTGRAKGSIRNFYYSSVKKAESDESFRQKYFDGKEVSTAKIIVFNQAESELLLERILIGQTFGKSVRRVIAEMTQNPSVALRYQNKYRNLLRYDKGLVLKMREQIVKEYGKCFNPYQKESEGRSKIGELKREINLLCEKIALSLKEENQTLKKKLDEVQRENAFLKTLLGGQEKGATLGEPLKNSGAV